MLHLTPLEPRDTPTTFASSGGVVYRVSDTGVSAEFARPFEAEAASVPLYLATDGDRVYVGAGVGGGPRMRAYDYNGGSIYDVFVGDPDSRTGVSVAVFPNAPKQPSPFPVTGYPGREPSPETLAKFQEQVDKIPRQVLQLLADKGVKFEVFTGRYVTELPEFQSLRGVSNPYGRDYSGTVGGNVGAVAYLAEAEAGLAIHEVGHSVDWALGGPSQKAEFRALRPGFSDALLQEEWAYGFNRWVNGTETDPALQLYYPLFFVEK